MRESGLNKRATELRERLGARRRKRTRTVPSGGSGLARASGIRARLGVGDGGGSSEGISADDRKEIAEEIDLVSRGNRLSARPEDFIVRPARKGFVFPLAVNLLALAATAGAVFLLSQAFRQRDLELASSASSLETAEGKLLRELKRDSESRLLEKDRAIADFQAKIAEIDRERDRLAEGIDDRIKAREAELRAALKDEIDAERGRLAAESLSASARESRLKVYETERTAALDRALAEDRARAEAEKSAAEARYLQLKDEYRKSIASLSEERRRMQEESRKREAEIKAQAEASARELEARGAAAMAGLEKAQAELSSLEEQKARREAIEERVLGLYDGIRSALRERRYEAAAAGAEALASYLEDPEIASDSALKARRDADLFVARTLGTYAREELARSAIDAGRLLEQASVLASAREAAEAAGAALKAGDADRARAKYGEALAKVPEILAAHEYFLERAAAEEAARRAKLEEYLAAAERAYRSGDRDSMIARYSSALEYLPVPEATRRTLVSRLGQAASVSDAGALDERKASDTAAARASAARAERRAAEKDWSGAIAEYLRLISAYPAADQVGEALKGIETARAKMQKQAQAAEAEARAALDVARSELAEAEAKAAAAEAASRTGARAVAELASSKQAEAALRSDIEALEKQLADERSKTAASAATAAPSASAAIQAAQAGRIEELQAEVARLSAMAQRYEGLVASYKAYRGSEAAAAAKGGPEELIEASAKLDDFLGGEPARSVLPGLQESVARYERAYQLAGQREVLYNALDVLDGAVGARDAASRDRYLKDLEGRYAGDEAMLGFIAGLRRNLR